MDGLYVFYKMKLFFHILVNCTNIFEKIAKSREIMFSAAYVSHTKIRLFRFFSGQIGSAFLNIVGNKQINRQTSQTNIYIFI